MADLYLRRRLPDTMKRRFDHLIRQDLAYSERVLRRAQGAPFSVVRTERRAAVVAESLCGTATGYAQLILQPSSLDNSADKIIHTRLGARSSTRNDELTLDLTRRIESQADLTATQQAFEDQV
jgi:hypothetical protein